MAFQNEVPHAHLIISRIKSFAEPLWLKIVWSFIVLITGGIAWVVEFWKPSLLIRLYAKECSLEKATLIVIFHDSGHVFTEPTFKVTSYHYVVSLLQCQISAAGSPHADTILCFIHQHVRYYYCSQRSTFVTFQTPDLLGALISPDFILNSDIPVGNVRLEQLAKHGSNTVEIAVPGVLILLYKEVLTPFYIFQALAIVLFYFEDYYYYAMCIAALSIISAATSLYETRKNLQNLRKISALHSTISIVTSSIKEGSESSRTTRTIDTSLLVPGDVVRVEANADIFPCDAVLMSGSCLINESMLTGLDLLSLDTHTLHLPLSSHSHSCPVSLSLSLPTRPSVALSFTLGASLSPNYWSISFIVCLDNFLYAMC